MNISERKRLNYPLRLNHFAFLDFFHLLFLYLQID